MSADPLGFGFKPDDSLTIRENIEVALAGLESNPCSAPCMGYRPPRHRRCMIAGAGPRLGVVYPSSLRLAQAAKRWVCRESREGGYVRPVFLWNASNPALLGSISPQIPFAEKRPAAIAYPPEDSVPAGLMNRLFMLRRFLRMFVPPFAALLLIAVAGIGAEYWLQGVPVQRSVVTGQSELSVQTLLQPSAVCHHQLRAGTRSQLPGPSGNSLTVRINSRGLRVPNFQTTLRFTAFCCWGMTLSSGPRPQKNRLSQHNCRPVSLTAPNSPSKCSTVECPATARCSASCDLPNWQNFGQTSSLCTWICLMSTTTLFIAVC